MIKKFHNMSTVTFTEEFTSTVAAPRLFKALIVDGDNLIPKIAPQALKNIEILEGNGGPGTIKKINFAEGLISCFSLLYNYIFSFIKIYKI